MFWIEGVGRNSEGFVLQTIAPDKGRQTQAMQQLSVPLELGRASRIRVTTDCATWTRDSGQAFWRELGIEAKRPHDGQGVFRFTVEGKHYLVPASVFIAAMMRPVKRIQACLFKPQGLESFCTPLLENESPSVGLHLSPTMLFGSQHLAPTGLLATYSWMHCFPSARAMYSSVYLAACNGRLDVTLPRACLTITLRSVKAGGIRLVTDLLITKLEALEAPYAFASNHSRHIVMHESAELDWKTLHQPVSTIPARDGEWHLSETEWQAIEPLLGERGETKFSMRDIIDLNPGQVRHREGLAQA